MQLALVQYSLRSLLFSCTVIQNYNVQIISDEFRWIKSREREDEFHNLYKLLAIKRLRDQVAPDCALFDTFPKQKTCTEGRVEAGLEEAGKDSVRVSALCLMPRSVWFKDFCTGEWHHTRGSVIPAWFINHKITINFQLLHWFVLPLL